jgi:hypothetical protein
MHSRILLVLVVVAMLVSPVVASDLYLVSVNSVPVADNLKQLNVDAIVKTNDGYLVLADGETADRLLTEEFDSRLIVTGITRNDIAVDTRMDYENVGAFPLLYEDGNVRLLQIDSRALSGLEREPGLSALPDKSLPIRFTESRSFDTSRLAAGVDLDSLIGLVSEDSLISYTGRLQHYNGRVTGTDSCYASADWTIAKFQEFGYDSTYYDEFITTIYGSPTVVKNTVAVKLGTRYPERYIIVGGHRDGVPGSPAADDNGSGSAGVLEIARILRNIDTDLSFVFITFSGEEQGLHGSWNHADEAAANGDTIEYMFNMDMIAYYENTSEAKLYHGSDASYSELWIHLADSLLGMTGYLQGNSSGSDHYPYSQYGYTVTFLHEYIFSSVYHSYQDSTSYMDFDYMTNMVKSGLATVYAAALDATAPGFEFAFPTGAPLYVEPGVENTLDVELVPVNDPELVPGSAMIHYRIDGGSYEDQPLSHVSGNEYQAILPVVDCDNTIEFYLSAEEAGGGIFTYSSAADPYAPEVASDVIWVIADSFETDLGWTTQISGASSGFWQRGVPVNDPNWDYDPISDADGSGSCFLTQNQIGNTDVDDGAVILLSPIFDFSGGGLLSYEYFLLLTVTTGGVDRLLVEINDNGGIGIWHEIARHDSDGGLEWRHNELSADDILAAGASLTTNMRVRFTANDADPQSIVEAGVDGFHVVSFECNFQEFICGDADGSGEVDIDDAVYLISYIFSGGPPPDPPEAGDADCSGDSDIDDVVYIIQYIFAGGPAPCDACP